jgi:hypothetical protein
MARDPLVVLRAMRHRAVEQARQGLAACLKIETEAAAKVEALTEAVRRDLQAAGEMPDAYRFLQVFANRRGAIRTQRSAAVAALATAQTGVSEARAFVVTERTQADAVEQLIAEQRAARLDKAERQAQHEMDDIARAAHAVRRGRRI